MKAGMSSILGKRRSWLCMEFLHKFIFGVRLNLDALYEIAREDPRNSMGRKKNRSKLTDFFSLSPRFWPFPSQSHTRHQVIVERRI